MEDEVVALPPAEAPKASDAAPQADAPAEHVEGAEGEAPVEAKPEKTPEQREIEKLRKAIDRKHKRAAMAEAELEVLRRQGLTPSAIGDHNRQDAGDSEKLTLSRAQMQELVRAEAEKLAPTLQKQRAAIEHTGKAVSELAEELGKEGFDALARDLEDAIGPVAKDNQPTPITEAIFKTPNPKALIKYLADDDNADEAAALRGLSGVELGIAIAELRFKAEAAAKPPRSAVPAPLESIRGATPGSRRLLDLEGDAFDKRRREQIAARR